MSPTKLQATILGIIGLSIGLLFSAQLHTKPPRVINPIEPFVSLEETKASLIKDQQDLKEKIKKLREEINQSRSAIKRSQSVNKELVEEVERLSEVIGLKEKRGVGVMITLSDARTGEVTVDSIVHASDIRDIVQVLWENEAQAISINDERVVATTSIDSINNTISVNTTKLLTPITIKAIGNPKKLTEQLLTHSALEDLRKRSTVNGLGLVIERVEDLTIPVFSGGFNIQVANIIE